jgi:hypothetical protein
MTIQLENGWAQWDWQIGTFRADINGEIYGKFTGDIMTAAELSVRLLPETALTQEQIAELELEKSSFEEIS